MGQCVDCGKDATGHRCRVCNNRLMARERATRIAKGDAWLLEQFKTRSAQSIATDLGLTRQAVHVRIRNAQKRIDSEDHPASN